MSAAPTPAFPTRLVWLVALGLAGATAVAYWRAREVPFVFDDRPAIVENESLRHLARLADVLWPAVQAGATVEGRPLLNLSFAVNYAAGGLDVRGYHALNVVIHLLAGLLLFGVVRRTLARRQSPGRAATESILPSAAVAALWLLHPLQTESVTYVAQRAESFAGLWYLLTLYAFVRGVDAPRPGRWLALSVAACLAGVATKETVATAPLVVLLYDRSFAAGTFGGSLRRRPRYYLGLALTWAFMALLVTAAGGRGGTAGFGAGISAWHYALTQCRAHFLYLKLAAWPQPLVFDRGAAVVSDWRAVWPQALALVAVAGATFWALVRRPACGFGLAAYFLLLAPSSSIVPVASQTIAEHRMYLALALPLLAVVLALRRWLGAGACAVAALLALAAGARTIVRNGDYASELALWSKTVADGPDNARAHHELGGALYRLERYDDAAAEFAEAIRLQPDDAESGYNLGLTLEALGRPAGARARYAQTLHLRPDYADAANALGLLALNDDRAQAVAWFRRAVRAAPNWEAARDNLANALLQLGRPADAAREAAAAVRLDAEDFAAHAALGNARAATGDLAAAAAEYEAALRLQPDQPEIHHDLANLRVRQGEWEAAVAEYRAALRLRPDFADTRHDLLEVLLRLGRPGDALALLEALARERPDDAEIRGELAAFRARRAP